MGRSAHRRMAVVTLLTTIAGSWTPGWSQSGTTTPTDTVPRSAFEANTTADLAALCGAAPTAPEYQVAAAFCHGFLQGAGQYHAAITQPGSGRAPVFCAPSPPPTRSQVAAAFVAWANAHPEYGRERAVDGLARWAHAAYPCAQSESRPRSR